jgi:hypothetical protein
VVVLISVVQEQTHREDSDDGTATKKDANNKVTEQAESKPFVQHSDITVFWSNISL